MKSTTKRGATKATKTVEVPSLAEVLGLLAGHVANVMTAEPGATVADLPAISFGCGLGGYAGTDCPLVILQGTITAARPGFDGGAWGPWAQVVLNGEACGNRHGATRAISKAYAPVVAWVVAYHAAKEAAELVAATPGPQLAKVSA